MDTSPRSENQGRRVEGGAEGDREGESSEETGEEEAERKQEDNPRTRCVRVPRLPLFLFCLSLTATFPVPCVALKLKNVATTIPRQGACFMLF